MCIKSACNRVKCFKTNLRKESFSLISTSFPHKFVLSNLVNLFNENEQCVLLRERKYWVFHGEPP